MTETRGLLGEGAGRHGGASRAGLGPGEGRAGPGRGAGRRTLEGCGDLKDGFVATSSWRCVNEYSVPVSPDDSESDRHGAASVFFKVAQF